MEYHQLPTSDDLGYLSGRLGVRALAFERRIFGGQSATSDVLIASDGSRVVLRRHGSWSIGFDDGIAEREAAVLGVAAAAGVPVPEVLWWGDIGTGTAIVTRLVPGVPVLEPRDQQRWASQLANVLASIHSVPVTGDLRHAVAAAPPQPVDLAPSPRFSEHPLGERLLRCRAGLQPRSTESPSLTHGDYWPGNLLWYEGDVAAVLDWEAAGVGDPIADVAYCYVELGLLGYDATSGHFIDEYTSASPVGLGTLDYWIATALCRALPELASYLDGWRPLGLSPALHDVQARLDLMIERTIAGHTAF